MISERAACWIARVVEFFLGMFLFVLSLMLLRKADDGYCAENRDYFVACAILSACLLQIRFMQNFLTSSRPGEFGLIDAIDLEARGAPRYHERKRMSTDHE